MRKCILIAYSFPPRISSGTRRIVSFVKYLTYYGWKPIVLTLKEPYYTIAASEDLIDVPEDINVIRTSACMIKSGEAGQHRHLDAKKLISTQVVKSILKGISIPDSAIGWLPFAVRDGLRILKEENCRVIFTSGPRFSTHLIGLVLKHLTHLAWVADFRDPWTKNPLYSNNSYLNKKIQQGMEEAVIRLADKVTATCPTVLSDFRQRYPTMPSRKFVWLSNGFDSSLPKADLSIKSKKLIFTYTGKFYPDSYGRKPDTFLRALANVLMSHPQMRPNILVRFVGELPDYVDQMITELRLQDVVTQIAFVSHRDAIKYQLSSSVLLLITGSDAETEQWAIPAKVYEYICAGRPILALTYPSSIVGDIILKTRTGVVVSENNLQEIENAIKHFYDEYIIGYLDYYPEKREVEKYDYKLLTSKLASIFNETCEMG